MPRKGPVAKDPVVADPVYASPVAVSYTHLRAHET